MARLSDLARDIVRYSEELHKVHKKVKEDESTTLEAVKAIQETTAMLQKSKEAYKQRCMEVERMRRDGGVSTGQLERSEAKFRRTQDEYKALVDKYCGVRDDFEKKMTLSSKHFQVKGSTYLILKEHLWMSKSLSLSFSLDPCRKWKRPILNR